MNQNTLSIFNLQLKYASFFEDSFGEPLSLYIDEDEGFDIESFLAMVWNTGLAEDFSDETSDGKIILDLCGAEVLCMIETLVGRKL